MKETIGFPPIAPEAIIEAVEAHLGTFLEPVLHPYRSYVNQTYGLRDEDGARFVVKFYRPGRWSHDAIAEEHRFLADCAEAGLSVVAPLPSGSGGTVGELSGVRFAVFPFRSGRTFDVYADSDWERLGSLVGSLHRVSGRRDAPARLRLDPAETTAGHLSALRSSGLVHPELAERFFSLADDALELAARRFRSLSSAPIRIHGDCHRGNILDPADGTLILIDFDDMMVGPAVQDLWLLLPDRLPAARAEMEAILSGYERAIPFDRASLALVEPLRFMRQVYFLHWVALQAGDPDFADRFPDWGGRAFWVTETEDLATQLDWIRDE